MNLALMVHNHQPVDNDPKIIEVIYKRAYLPFLKMLAEFPSVRANLHYSGYLLEWIAERHPEFVELLRELVDREQVELVAGGYYEPILTCIPDEDAKGQVSLLVDEIESLFERRPRGFWTAERAWEPQMPELLHGCGMDYTTLDDTIFMSSGIPARDCFRPFAVESRGSVVSVFPMLKTLRYLIPWKSERLALSFLRKNSDSKGERLAVFGDDGEKFGSWPTTFEKVYTEGWLRRFLGLITSNGRWLSMVRLSDYLKDHPARDCVHLPASSYDEMTEWAVPVARRPDRETRKRVRGFWRAFLSKYPESGRMYSRMLSVSRMVASLPRDGRTAALRELWKGQCNDAYWHGVFGGLYSPALRRITYHHLIEAQNIAESAAHRSRGWLDTKEELAYGSLEQIVNTSSLSVRLSPDAGGSIVELDFKAPAVNVSDTLQRRKEAYHANLTRTAGKSKKRSAGVSPDNSHEASEEGLRELLVYDRYPKFSFLDFMVGGNTGIDDFLRQSYTEVASLAGRPYAIKRETYESGVSFDLSRVSNRSGSRSPVSLHKRIIIPAERPEITARYTISAGAEGRLPDTQDKLAVEISFSSLGSKSFIEKYSKPTNKLAATNSFIDFKEMGLRASLTFSEPVDLWSVPIMTVSRSEEGYQSNLQGVSVLPWFSLAEHLTEFEIRLALEKI